jgi:hypothetical protein
MLEIGNKLHEAMSLWKDGMKSGMVGFLKCGKAIHLLKQGKLWELAGFANFPSYVKNELKISIPQAHRLEQVYREVGAVIEKHDISIDISSITLLLPYLKGKSDEEKKTLLEANSELPVEAIRNNLLEMEGKRELATDVCPHTDGFDYYRKCRKCNKFLVDEK